MEVAKRLRYARTRAGLTLTQVRERSGIGESSLCEFEGGKREPSLSQLQALAEAYRRSAGFFLAEGEIPSEIALWREQPCDGGRDVEATFFRLCQQYHNLEMWTGEAVPTSLGIASGSAESFSYRHAEGLAKSFRDRFELGDRPSLSLLTVLEEECGVKVFHLSFEPTGTAASTMSPTFGAAIVLNAANVRWRRNFDLAHELFHLLTWTVFRDHSSSATSMVAPEREESLANSFASQLLMPAEAMQTAFGGRIRNSKLYVSELHDIARQFDVSVSAVLWRSFHLKLLAGTADEIRALVRRVESARGPDADRRDTTPRKWPDRYKALAIKALRSGAMSVGRFASYLEISRQEAMKYLEQEATDGEEVPLAPA